MDLPPAKRDLFRQSEANSSYPPLESHDRPSFPLYFCEPQEEPDEATAATARYLTTPAVETTQGLLYSPIEDKVELRQTAQTIFEELNEELSQQLRALQLARRKLEPLAGVLQNDSYRQLTTALNYAERGNGKTLEQMGLKLNLAWLNDIVRNMLKNRPVEIQITEPRQPYVKLTWGPRREETQDKRVAAAYDNIFNEQTPGIEFAAMLRRIQGFDYTRPVAMVDDSNNQGDHFALQSLHKWRTLQKTYELLQDKNVVNENDQPGKDFIIAAKSRGTQRFDELIEKLQKYETGLVVPYKDGSLYLRPSDRIYASVMQQHSAENNQLHQQGILLQNPDGSPTSVANNAASYLDAVNTQFTHVRLLPYAHRSLGRDIQGSAMPAPQSQQELSILLQSLDITYPDRDHNIYYDRHMLSSAHIVYALTQLLQNEVKRVIRSLDELDDVRMVMKPRDYFMHNYNSGKGVWPEDIQGIRTIATELPLNFNPGEVESAAIIGYGPFSYPGLALAPFMKEGAVIDISDLLPNNIEFVKEWFSGTADAEHAGVYRTFAELFKQGPQSGRYYEDCEELLRAAGRLQVAALEDIPSNSAEVVVETFVSCSKNIEKLGFYGAIREKARILKWTPRGMMISVHMVGSGGWNNSGDDEGIKIPAANLSMNEIEDAYRSAGLRIVKSTPLHADSGFRKDYKGMVVIFARPDTLEKPTSIPS